MKEKAPVGDRPDDVEEIGGGYGMRNKRQFPWAMAFLEQVRKAQRRVELIEDRIRCLDLMMTDIAVHLSEVHVRSSGDPQKNEWYMAQKDELEREKTEAEAEKEQVLNQVRKMISRIPNPDAQEVLIHYYLNGKTWEQAAQEIHYSKMQAYRLRDEGYEELERMLQERAEKEDPDG